MTPAPTDDERCSARWGQAGLPAWGTATPADFWVCLEQPGPWGARAWTESRLDPAVGSAIEAGVAAAGGRALLIRAADDHREDAGGPRRLFVASPGPGRPWLLTGLIDDPARLAGVPWGEAVSAGPLAVQGHLPDLRPCPDPLLLVCTNGRRDLCCATSGRRVVAYVAGQRGPLVWECTHTGGHRFAPTGVVLPLGVLYARLDGPLAIACLDAGGRGQIPAGALDPAHLRGLAHRSPTDQVADAAARIAGGLTDVFGVSVTETPGRAATTSYEVSFSDGRTWRVDIDAD